MDLSEWQSYYGKALGVADIVHITDVYEAYVTYVDDDEYFDNHDYDDDTDDDTDNDTGDDTDDDICTIVVGISI